MLELHDVPGEHVAMVRLPAYAKASDDGLADVVFVAPFDCKLTAGTVYFQGTADVGAATNYFKFVTMKGTVPIGTVSLDSAKSFLTGLALFSGTTSMDAGDKIVVQYGTVGSGLDAPESIVVLKYKGA